MKRLLLLLTLVTLMAVPVTAERWPLEGNINYERVTFGGWNAGFAAYNTGLVNTYCLLTDTFPGFGYSYGSYVRSILTLPTCSSNLNFELTTWLFPTNAKNVRLKGTTCWMIGTGMTNGEVIRMTPRWRDYTGTGVQSTGAASQIILTVAGGGAFTSATGGAGPIVCPYSTCGLSILINSSTFTSGTDIKLQCSAMVQWTYGS